MSERKFRTDDWRVWCVTCGGLGMAPVAPGTFGTLGGVLIAWALSSSTSYLAWSMVAAAAVYLLGRALAPAIEERYGKDPGFFVLDEVVGYLITMAALRGPSALGLVVGFVVFRTFDVLKPFPIKRLERVGGSDGIMLDDVMAGLYGLAVMWLLQTLFPGSSPHFWFLGVER
ncbi:MAG: phosphatidylglycerophosphatase A [Planctomycetota bacterium]